MSSKHVITRRMSCHRIQLYSLHRPSSSFLKPHCIIFDLFYRYLVFKYGLYLARTSHTHCILLLFDVDYGASRLQVYIPSVISSIKVLPSNISGADTLDDHTTRVTTLCDVRSSMYKYQVSVITSRPETTTHGLACQRQRR